MGTAETIKSNVTVVAYERFSMDEINDYINQLEKNNMQMLKDMPQYKEISYDLKELYSHVSANQTLIEALKDAKHKRKGVH